MELLPLQPGDPKALEFDVPPSIDLATGDLSFTIKHRIYPDSSGEEAEDKWVSSAGLARVRVTLQDDGGTRRYSADGFARWLAGFLSYGPAALRLDFAALRRVSGLSRQPMAAFRVRAVAALQDFLDLGAIAAIESAGPDRLIVTRPAARGEEPACLLLS